MCLAKHVPILSSETSDNQFSKMEGYSQYLNPENKKVWLHKDSAVLPSGKFKSLASSVSPQEVNPLYAESRGKGIMGSGSPSSFVQRSPGIYNNVKSR